MQLNATKILNVIIHDMLDYAQLSAGQFRKFVKKFNLIEVIYDVFNIMNHKATELGITVEIDVQDLLKDNKQIVSANLQNAEAHFSVRFDE